MRISDWSSDVCSSDLTLAFAYEGSKQIHVADKASCEALGRMEIEQVGATDRLDIFVFGNERTGQARLIAALDNLGKGRSEEHTSELQSLMRISYAVFCLKKKKRHVNTKLTRQPQRCIIHTTYEQ